MRITGRRRENQKGMILAIVTILLFLLTSLSLYALVAALNQRLLVDKASGSYIRTYYYARAGLVDAHWLIRNNDPEHRLNNPGLFTDPNYDPPAYCLDLVDDTFSVPAPGQSCGPRAEIMVDIGPVNTASGQPTTGLRTISSSVDVTKIDTMDVIATGTQKVSMTSYYPYPEADYKKLKAKFDVTLGLIRTSTRTQVGIGTLTPGEDAGGNPLSFNGRDFMLDVKKRDASGNVLPGEGNIVADDVFLASPLYGAQRWASLKSNGIYGKMLFYTISSAMPHIGIDDRIGSALCERDTGGGVMKQGFATGGGYEATNPDPEKRARLLGSRPFTDVADPNNVINNGDSVGWYCRLLADNTFTLTCYANCVEIL